MTVVRGLLITVFSGVLFSLLGGLFGWTLGRLAPDYYRSVLRIPPSVDLSPSEVGVGLGATQGMAVGIGVGLVIVVTVAWYQSRTSRS